MARFRVSSEADVVEAVRAARESRRTLEIVGHGTKCGFGRPLECDDVLDVSSLSGIVSYEPDEMIITARAGTPVADIEAALAGHNQRLGFEPADWGPLFRAPPNAATIGGVLSASCDGSAAVRYGRCRDHLLGFRAVNGFGEAYKGGGKVVKNVTGFDLPKLFCGAMGTLGPLTEVTLRVFPNPPLSTTFALHDLSSQAGLPLLRRVWSSALDPTALAFHQSTAFIRIEGSQATLDEKLVLLRDLSEREPQRVEDGDNAFRRIAAGQIIEKKGQLWRICLPPANTVKLIAEIQPRSWCADWAGSLLWLVSDREVRAIARTFDAWAVLMRGGPSIPLFAPENRVRAELTKRVNAAFDPLRLFNPGRMWEGL